MIRHGGWSDPYLALFPVYTIAGSWEYCCLVQRRQLTDTEGGRWWVSYEWRRAPERGNRNGT